MLSPSEIARMIDLSCVRASHTEEEILAVAQAAGKYNCAAVFALPAHTPLLIEALADSPDVVVGGVVGFPDGSATTTGKVHEARELTAMGCREIDMVLNITWLKSGKDDRVREDIAAVVQAVDVPVKVIFECHYLTNEEIARACEISVDAGAAFVKTGTGWAETGATLENVAIMKQAVGDRCEVKAAGGVKDLETLLAMHERGVTRFGIGLRTATAILEGIGSSEGDDY